jgi:glutamyl-tRNA reductase
MSLIMVGTNFRTAPVELRERLSFSASQVPQILQRMERRFQQVELALLSTCNRSELYAAGPDVENMLDELILALLESTEEDSNADWKEHFVINENAEAAAHLLAVASSLESMVVGETEILGQVKQAYMLAVDAGTCGTVLHQLFQNVSRAAKRVHTETDICRGRVSVSSIAVDFAEKVFDDPGSKTVMVVGAGQTSELTLKSLIETGVKDIIIVNRSLDKAQSLVERHGGRAVQFDTLDEHLPAADIVISSTDAPHFVLNLQAVRKAVESRRGRPMLLIDIAVPRDIDERVSELENVYLYNIDDLQSVAAANISKRREAVDDAWIIVKEEASLLAATADSEDLTSVMKKLDQMARGIAEAELKRTLGKEKFNNLPAECRAEIEQMAERLVSSTLAKPRKELNKAKQNGKLQRLVDATYSLFDLKKEHKNADK